MSTNHAYTREYFEEGCLCLISGKILGKARSVPDREAVEYYEASCTCSRNYKHLEDSPLVGTKADIIILDDAEDIQ